MKDEEKIRHCEEGALPDEAISNTMKEIASGEEQEHPPRNDILFIKLSKQIHFISEEFEGIR